jgi:hypothetical protein
MERRMSAEERRDQLIGIMREMRKSAKHQADFTARKVADKAKISVVLLYRLAGAEFKQLRADLEGRRRPVDETLAHLRKENLRLAERVRQLEEEKKETLLADLKGAIEMIEMLEEQNLLLGAELDMLKSRMAEDTEFIESEELREEEGEGQPVLSLSLSEDDQ